MKKVAGKKEPPFSREAAEADETASFFHLPPSSCTPLWRHPQAAEQMCMRLWWKGISNRANPYSFMHKEHSLLFPDPVGYESAL